MNYKQEDYDLASEYIVLDLVIRTMEKDIAIFQDQDSKHKFPHIWQEQAENATLAARTRMRDLKAILHKNGIKVIKVHEDAPHTQRHIRYDAWVRGYQINFNFWTAQMRRLVSSEMKKYLIKK